jgi:diguanylate cyclase (GGDEF)-like protein
VIDVVRLLDDSQAMIPRNPRFDHISAGFRRQNGADVNRDKRFRVVNDRDSAAFSGLPRSQFLAYYQSCRRLRAAGLTMEIQGTKSAVRATAARKSEARRSSESAAVAPTSDALAIAGVADADLTPKLRQAIMGLLGEVEQLRRELGEARARIGYLERLADEDPLVPVANRRAFVRELTRMMSFAQRYGTAASIIYFDINRLKQINDRYSHAAGDAALLQVARVLIENVRNSDVVGRLGGDEIGVLLVQTDQELAQQKAAQLAAAVAAKALIWQGQEIQLSVSYGVHSLRGDENAGDALDAADRAMYSAKERRGASTEPA